MFKSSGNKESAQAKKITSAGSSSHAINTLVSGTNVEGDIVAQNDFRIDGKLVGNLECAGKVIIGPEGLIEGSVKCKNAMIEGTVKGDIAVGDLLTVMETGKIVGNIKTDRLKVLDGAKFNVNCEMDGQALNPTSKQSTSAKRKDAESKGLVFDA